ncbi:hypothetical protein HMPREF1574_00008, partial [Gardnerella pickettii JCP7659]
GGGGIFAKCFCLSTLVKLRVLLLYCCAHMWNCIKRCVNVAIAKC